MSLNIFKRLRALENKVYSNSIYHNINKLDIKDIKVISIDEDSQICHINMSVDTYQVLMDLLLKLKNPQDDNWT